MTSLVREKASSRTKVYNLIEQRVSDFTSRHLKFLLSVIFQQTSEVRVLVVEDHELTRYCLQLSLEQCGEIDLVGMACNGLEAIEMVERHRPDVLIMDLQMPLLDGFSASEQIKSIAPQTKIVVYSSLERSAVDSKPGIDAFCQKDTPIETLINTVKQLGRS